MSAEQPELPGLAELLGVRGDLLPAGPVEKAVAASVRSAGLDPSDFGAALVAVSLARAMDRAAGERKPAYAVAAVARELREQLARLKLDPAARDGGDGDDETLKELLRAWTEPTTG